jgi:hypothetical protein
MRLEEPVLSRDLCDFCGHSWHGLPCKCIVRSSGHTATRNCTCGSSIPQFRAEQGGIYA